jgi:hypothetical protein
MDEKIFINISFLRTPVLAGAGAGIQALQRSFRIARCLWRGMTFLIAELTRCFKDLK